MPFDDIPEDYRPSYPCERCDEGNVTENEELDILPPRSGEVKCLILLVRLPASGSRVF